MDADTAGYMQLALSELCEPIGGSIGGSNQGDTERLTRQDVADFFLRCSDVDARWVLEEIKTSRPGLFIEEEEIERKPTGQEALPLGWVEAKDHATGRPYYFEKWNPKETTTWTRPSFVDAIVDTTRVPKRKGSHIFRESFVDADRLPVVQFASSVFFCTVAETHMHLDVMRIGSSAFRTEVAFYTENESAVSGDHYEETRGHIVFEPGENMQVVEVKLVDNGRWSTTTEFKVVLSEVGLEGATLGHYLFETRVRIIDTTTFPTPRLNNVLLKDIWPGTVLLEYCKMTWAMPVVRKGTIFCLCADLTHNLWYFLHLFMMVYLLDNIVKVEEPLVIIQNRKASLLLWAAMTIIVMGLLHWLDYSKTMARVGGTATSFLQGALIRKFLNYANSVRATVNIGDVVMAAQRDCQAVVGSGYMSVLKLISQAEKLILLLMFQILSPIVFGKTVDLITVGQLMIFPVLFAIFLPWRQETVSHALSKSHAAQEDVINTIAITATNCDLVIDFSMRNQASHRVQEALKDGRAAHREATQTLLNTSYFANWVTCIIVGGVVYIGGSSVISGSLSIGAFVTNLRVFDRAGLTFQEIFQTFVEIQSIFPSMINITRLLNQHTDVRERMIAKRAQRKRTKKQREDILSHQSHIIAVDVMPISIQLDDQFHFDGANKFAPTLNFSGHLDVLQGQIVALIGSVGSGKATLLHLVSGKILLPPGKSEFDGVFVPAHLRIVNVAESPVFYDGTLYENLTLGCNMSHGSVDRERVAKVCKRLAIPDSVLGYMEQNKRFHEIFSVAQCKLLNIARALVHNAEVMCFHKPIANLDPDFQPIAMKALRDHVQNRGLCLDHDSSTSRPRTIFISSANPLAVNEADSIYRISRTTGITAVRRIEGDEPEELRESIYHPPGSAEAPEGFGMI